MQWPTKRPSRPAAVLAATVLAAAVAVAVLAAVERPAGAHEAPETTYTVRAGDTLSEIALRLAVRVQTLIAVNSIGDPHRIVAGRELRLPGGAGALLDADGDAGTGAGAQGTHVVRPGETLSDIAARYGTSVRALAEANGISDVDRIWVGNELRLASTVPAATEPATRSGHVVRPGETLSDVAARYGTSVRALAEANGISDVDLVVAGTVLSVPGGWRCPTPAVSRFVDDFAVRKPDGRTHHGIDLFAPRGSPFVAPVAGVATQIRGVRGGLQVTLDGDDGHRYIGSHLDSFGAAGRVTAGEVLGTVGSTGNARGTDPHVHFELLPGGGVPANPYEVLVGACPR